MLYYHGEMPASHLGLLTGVGGVVEDRFCTSVANVVNGISYSKF